METGKGGVWVIILGLLVNSFPPEDRHPETENTISGQGLYHYKADAEMFMVLDAKGYVEVFDERLLFDNPDIYTWTNTGVIDNTAIHFFDMR